MSPNLLRQALRHDRLHDAWLNVDANGGAPGGDHVTLRQFRGIVDEELLRLIEDVESRTYRPGPARKTHIHTNGKLRQIAVVPVRDRVLQRSVLDVLTPLVDRQFLHCSYGYRPGRGIDDAVRRLVALRDRGLTTVVDADLRDCFGSIDHQVLAKAVAGFVPDPILRELIGQWYLPQPTTLRPVRAPSHGINLGAPISPMLCNMVLHDLDRALLNRRLQPVRYADDFVIACADRDAAGTALEIASRVLARLRLQLNPVKTRISSFDEGFVFLGVHFEGSTLWFEHEGLKIAFEGDLPPDIADWPSPYAPRGW